MRQKFTRLGAVWHAAIALVTVILLCLISSPPAAAQIAEEYFQISYEPVGFSKTEIHGDEVFYATLQGHATCTKDLPVSVSEARITGKVIAEHTVSGTQVTLNSSYTTIIKRFPYKAGDTIEINEVIYLQFPYQGESGDYDITLEIGEAEIKIFLWWVDVRDYLPQDLDQLIGTLNYIAGVESPTPTITLTPAVTPTATATPKATPAAGLGTGTWVGIGIGIAISFFYSAGAGNLADSVSAEKSKCVKALHCAEKCAIIAKTLVSRYSGQRRGTGSLWTKMNYCLWRR